VLPDEFVEHSPRLEIPMVRVGTDYLADSIPVLEWLEDRVEAPTLLPADDAARSLVRERMAWIDRHAFRPMIGIYYGVEPDAVAQASEALADALAEMGRWTAETGWLAGAAPSLAEAETQRAGSTNGTASSTDQPTRSSPPCSPEPMTASISVR